MSTVNLRLIPITTLQLAGKRAETANLLISKVGLRQENGPSGLTLSHAITLAGTPCGGSTERLLISLARVLGRLPWEAYEKQVYLDEYCELYSPRAQRPIGTQLLVALASTIPNLFSLDWTDENMYAEELRQRLPA